MNKILLSVIVITKNEEDVIEKCLESVKDIADELIVIDDSKDTTPEIAKKMGARVIHHSFQNFADQRNVAVSHAKGDWLFYIDADEVATKEFKDELMHTVKKGEKNGYFIKRKTFYFGIDWGYTDKLQRVFKKEAFKGWKGAVHETPYINGEFGEIGSPVLHFAHREIGYMLTKTNEWSEDEALLRFRAHHPKMTPLRFARVMLTAFFQSYIKENGYKNGTAGVIEGLYQGFSMFVTYAKLWEMQNRNRD